MRKPIHSRIIILTWVVGILLVLGIILGVQVNQSISTNGSSVDRTDEDFEALQAHGENWSEINSNYGSFYRTESAYKRLLAEGSPLIPRLIERLPADGGVREDAIGFFRKYTWVIQLLEDITGADPRLIYANATADYSTANCWRDWWYSQQSNRD